MFPSEQLTHHMAAAARVYGDVVLDADQEASLDPRATLGRRLLQEIFGIRDSNGPLPDAVQALIMDPVDPEARHALEGHVQGVLTDDPVLAAVVAETLIRFYRNEITAGNIRAMRDLGDLLRSQDDHDGARAAYQRAADSGDPDVAPEALVDLGHLLMIFSATTGKRALTSGRRSAPRTRNGRPPACLAWLWPWSGTVIRPERGTLASRPSSPGTTTQPPVPPSSWASCCRSKAIPPGHGTHTCASSTPGTLSGLLRPSPGSRVPASTTDASARVPMTPLCVAIMEGAPRCLPGWPWARYRDIAGRYRRLASGAFDDRHSPGPSRPPRSPEPAGPSRPARASRAR